MNEPDQTHDIEAIIAEWKQRKETVPPLSEDWRESMAEITDRANHGS